jgi:hypothetical protein
MTEEERRAYRNTKRREAYKRDGGKRKRLNKEWKDANRLKVRDREREYMRVKAGTGEGYRRLWLSNCKYRAKQKGVPFNLTLEDIEFTDICPILGIPMVMRAGSFHDNSPSIDRIIPAKGYVKGNVRMISYRANRLKAHGSLEDLRKIVAWMERELA